MDNFKTELSILSDTLTKKEEALEQILAITENQTVLFDSSENLADVKDFFSQMNDEKQELIDIVLSCDTVYENVSKKYDNYEELAQNYKPQIKVLQEQIKRVMDLDVKIRIQESKNKELLQRFNIKQTIKTPRASKQFIINEYEKNKKKNND